MVLAPTNLAPSVTGWRLLNDRLEVERRGAMPAETNRAPEPIRLGQLPVGWYRIEFDTPSQSAVGWTSLAVLERLRARVPEDSPIALDSAASWFALNDAVQQKRLANLAALAGVSWVRDRLRWGEMQPGPDALKAELTTYDTSAEAHCEEGLRLLQVFHDTPAWARGAGESGGQFATDLRRVYEFGRELAIRFRGRVKAWEPWNEANVATFGSHTVDQMCSWQKAAWLGFKAGDPEVIVGWNATAAVPTPAHTEGVLANETWPYFDTYNIHTYDWSDSYFELWGPAREAAAGRPLWITEADRGTPHLKNPPWYDQDPRLERLKAEWIAQAYASSLFAGASRHFHFILGNYQEPNGVQFGLLRYDLTPRPGYVALAAVGRCLAGARALGRWQPGEDVHVYAFRAVPDGEEHDVLVMWAERRGDWNERGTRTASWPLPAQLRVREIVDYLGRSHGTNPPARLTSAPIFVFLPPGQAASLPLERPPASQRWREGKPSPVVLQALFSEGAKQRVEDLPWSEGYAYGAKTEEPVKFKVRVYNFATNTVSAHVALKTKPVSWEITFDTSDAQVEPMSFKDLACSLRVPTGDQVKDGWVALRADCGDLGRPAMAFRWRVR